MRASLCQSKLASTWRFTGELGRRVCSVRWWPRK